VCVCVCVWTNLTQVLSASFLLPLHATQWLVVTPHLYFISGFLLCNPCAVITSWWLTMQGYTAGRGLKENTSLKFECFDCNRVSLPDLHITWLTSPASQRCGGIALDCKGRERLWERPTCSRAGSCVVCFLLQWIESSYGGGGGRVG
jgi:hypothetical protein